MEKPEIEVPRGILDPRSGEKRFRLSRHPPSGALKSFVELYWIVEWDLRGREPYRQENLPHPCIHLVFERGDSRVYGVVQGKFSRMLADKGRVFGVKFRPGGFYPFVKGPISRLTDRVMGLREVFGVESAALEEGILSLQDEGKMVAAAETFLRARVPERDESVELVGRVIDCITQNRDITRVSDVASRVDVNQRTLQRLFSRYVGVSPKWVIRRYRLHEAAERLSGDKRVKLGELALDLGYFDQAHFVKDFCAMVGVAPAEYARGVRQG